MTVLFGSALAALVVLALLGRTCRLQKLTALLLANFVAYNVLFHSGLTDRQFMVGLGLMDAASAYYGLRLMHANGAKTFMTVIALYFIMVMAHAAFWQAGAGPGYYALLNILFAGQLAAVGGGLVGRVYHLRLRSFHGESVGKSERAA